MGHLYVGRVALTYRFRRDWLTGQRTTDIEIVSDGICEGPHWRWEWNDPADTSKGGRNVDQPAATLAHVGFEIVAQVLAAPIRKAYQEHLAAADGTEQHRLGLAHCADCQHFWSLLPEGDVPVGIA